MFTLSVGCFRSHIITLMNTGTANIKFHRYCMSSVLLFVKVTLNFLYLCSRRSVLTQTFHYSLINQTFLFLN